MQIRKTHVITTIFLTTLIVFAQTPDTLWTRVYGGAENEYGVSVIQTFNGDYVIVGQTYSYGSGYGDAYMLRTSEYGDTLWTKVYGGGGFDAGLEVQQTRDSGFVVVGLTESNGTFGDLYLFKTDINGDTLWSHNYGGTAKEQGYSVDQTADGGYMAAGYTLSSEPAFYLVKTDSMGEYLWSRTYGGGSWDLCFSAQETADSGFILAGFTSSFGFGGQVYLVKTDRYGDVMWHKTYGGVGEESGEAVIQTSDGGYIITGYTSSFGSGGIDVYIVKTNDQGTLLWDKAYGGLDDDCGCAVQETYDGGYVIVGDTRSFSAAKDLYIIKTDQNGDTIWTRTYGGSYYDRGWDIKQTSDSGYIVVGDYGYDGPSWDIWLLKFTPEFGIEEGYSWEKQNDIGATIFSGPFIFSEGVNYKILDITGRQIHTLDPTPGIYFIEVDGEIRQKVIKIR